MTAPLTVISDTIHVLSSPRLYHLPRTEIVALLMPLLRLRIRKLGNRRVVLHALEIYLAHPLDFTDAVILSWMRQTQSKIVYLFDQDFDGSEGITHKEP